VGRDGVMEERGGIKSKINKRIAHIKWLLFKNQTPSPLGNTPNNSRRN